MEALVDAGLVGAGVLSGNRKFEGRVMHDIATAPLGHDADGNPVFLHELWPSDEEVRAIVRAHVQPEFLHQRNKTLWLGTHHWQKLAAKGSVRFSWEPRSTYLRRPAYTTHIDRAVPSSPAIRGARALMVLGDNVTTDHISPVGRIPADSLAGRWLLERGEAPEDLNQYSTRRSNHEVMLRGAFTTRNLRNLMLGQAHPTAGGAHAWTLDGSTMRPVYEAAQSYKAAKIPTLIFAGINYGAGSSRDWAAKAPALLGVRAVVATSFERIHRSNLIGMGVFPLEIAQGEIAKPRSLTGREAIDVEGLDDIAVTCARASSPCRWRRRSASRS